MVGGRRAPWATPTGCLEHLGPSCFAAGWEGARFAWWMSSQANSRMPLGPPPPLPSGHHLDTKWWQARNLFQQSNPVRAPLGSLGRKEIGTSRLALKRRSKGVQESRTQSSGDLQRFREVKRSHEPRWVNKVQSHFRPPKTQEIKNSGHEVLNQQAEFFYLSPDLASLHFLTKLPGKLGNWVPSVHIHQVLGNNSKQGKVLALSEFIFQS